MQFDPHAAGEIGKTRPAVVVSAPEVGRLPLRIVVPITNWNPRYAQFIWMVRIQATPLNGLTKDSSADAFQVKSVATSRFVQLIGRLTDSELEDIVAAVALCIGFA